MCTDSGGGRDRKARRESSSGLLGLGRVWYGWEARASALPTAIASAEVARSTAAASRLGHRAHRRRCPRVLAHSVCHTSVQAPSSIRHSSPRRRSTRLVGLPALLCSALVSPPIVVGVAERICEQSLEWRAYQCCSPVVIAKLQVQCRSTICRTPCDHRVTGYVQFCMARMESPKHPDGLHRSEASILMWLEMPSEEVADSNACSLSREAPNVVM